MDQIINYINPELLVLVPVLLLAGAGIKHTQAIADKWIPLLLGVAGVALSLIWVIANGAYTRPQDVLLAAFTTVCQGILCAGAAVYCHQLGKQIKKED